MATATVRITDNIQAGIHKLGARLKTIDDVELRKGLEAATKEARGGWPGGPNQGYTAAFALKTPPKRTGNLGISSNWHIEGASYRFETNAYSVRGEPYSVGVLGDGNGGGQWRVHRGRWPLAVQVMLKWAKSITAGIQSAADKAMAEIK